MVDMSKVQAPLKALMNNFTFDTQMVVTPTSDHMMQLCENLARSIPETPDTKIDIARLCEKGEMHSDQVEALTD